VIPSKRAWTLVLALAIVALGAGVSSCANLNEPIINACPSQEIFEQSVSPFLEQRCGTLDCHGSIARPMRVFGGIGLRHPEEDNVSGGVPTTAIERTANYDSVCGVDAEKMNGVVADLGNSAEELLIVRKARGLEKHKGGKVVNENDHGDLCILHWLRGNDGAAEECQAAVEQLNP
jgi:hypothetical protein